MIELLNANCMQCYSSGDNAVNKGKHSKEREATDREVKPGCDYGGQCQGQGWEPWGWARVEIKEDLLR